MIKSLVLIFLFLPVLLFGQGTDTLFQPLPPDSTIVSDTLFIPVASDTSVIIDTASVQDTIGLLDSARTAVIVDTLRPLHQQPLDKSSSFLSENEINRIYSGYAEHLLEHSGKIFIRDYAFPGHPDDIFYYGSNQVSFTEDGLSLSRTDNYYNVQQVQTGSIDSIEFIPAVKGFMYGQDLNPASINFISKDFLSEAPYSRIKYYEGPFGEAMIDGIFNSIFFNKLNIFAEVTNRSSERRYVNTVFSSWQAMVKTKYLFSDAYNFIASYSYNRSLGGLNGGAAPSEDIYDELQAVVRYSSRELEDKQHLFKIRLLASPAAFLKSDLNIYYRFSFTQIIPNDDSSPYSGYKNKTLGAFINQNIDLESLSLVFAGSFEQSDYKVNNTIDTTGFNTYDLQDNQYSFSATGTLNLLDSILFPSVFYRFGNFSKPAGPSYGLASSKDIQGIGADINFYPVRNLDFYAGYSVVDNFHYFTRGSTLEAGLKYTSEIFSLNGSVYRRNDYSGYYYPFAFSLINVYPELNHTGAAGNISLKLWKILLASTFNHVLTSVENDNLDSFGLPELTSRTGLYFDDIVFNGNLDLRTGFVFYYWGRQLSIRGEGFDIPSSYRFDFSLAGEIQKAAVIYFLWENITDNKYFLTQYYPMPFSGIKFGVSWELFN